LAEKEETEFKEKDPFMEIVFGPLWDQQSLFLDIFYYLNNLLPISLKFTCFDAILRKGMK
jgi:hypothetical protein